MKPDIPKKAPGQKLVKRMPLRTKWLLCASAGLLLFGFGISVVSHAATLKADPTVNFARWFIAGLYGLILTNLGLVCFGQAIRFRVLMDINKKFNQHEKDQNKLSKKVNHLGEILRNKEDKRSK
jgi:hypothetical protein